MLLTDPPYGTTRNFWDVPLPLPELWEAVKLSLIHIYPPGHNPHAHVLLTMRAMDEHGKWLPKSRKVYDLDENGERIKLPSGRWKSHKEDTVDWNDQKYCERCV